jgi:hypothetical protein
MSKTKDISFFDLTKDRLPWGRYKTFRRVFYGLLILLSVINFFDFEAFYGVDSFVHKDGLRPSNLTLYVLNVLSIKGFENAYWFFGVAQVVALTLSYFDKFQQTLSVVIWFLTVNLINRASIIFTGGEVLVKLLLFLMIFIQVPKKEYKAEFNRMLRNVLNNVFFVACQIQVIFVYIFSSWFKLLDPNWFNGDAIYYISQIDSYSNSFLTNLMKNHSWVSKTATILALIYQSLFPILIWFKKIKPVYLLIGVIFHLFIAFGMGIFSFGMIMISCYLLFYTPKYSRTRS